MDVAVQHSIVAGDELFEGQVEFASEDKPDETQDKVPGGQDAQGRYFEEKPKKKGAAGQDAQSRRWKGEEDDE